MAITDWFKKAKEAKKEKEKPKPKKSSMGFLGSKASPNAYKEAEEVLAEADREQ